MSLAYTCPMRLLTVIGAIAVGLSACGQTGPLYLPDEGVQTPVEIRGPATPPPAAQPAEPEEDKDKKPVPPAGG